MDSNSGQEMTEAEYNSFVKNLSKIIQDRGLVQNDIAAKAGVSAVNMSKVLNFKSGCSAKWRKKICDAIGVTVDSLVDKPKEVAQPERRIHITPTNHVDLREVLSGLTALINKLGETTDRARMWKSVFDALPIAAIIVKDDKVIFQNQRSKAFGLVSGENVCLTCANADECNGDDCALHRAHATGIEASEYKVIKGTHYKVICVPVTVVDASYIIITATEIDECGSDMQNLDRIIEEREFIASCDYEPAEIYYSDADQKITYINKSFLTLFGVERREMRTAQDFITMLSSKLFYPPKIVALALSCRNDGIAAEESAKLLTGNETVRFVFRPHKKNGMIIGIMVVVLPLEG